MYRLCSLLAVIISSVVAFGCVSTSPISARSWDFRVQGNDSAISQADLAAAITAADAKRIYRVQVVSRNHVRVDVSDGLHNVGDYDEKGRYFVRRFHGEPDYVIVSLVLVSRCQKVSV